MRQNAEADVREIAVAVSDEWQHKDWVCS